MTNAIPDRRGIAPGATARVAMIGGGQLAQMTQQAATSLGVDLRVLAQDPAESAVASGAHHDLASWSSAEEVVAFAAGADVVTFDHELVAPSVLDALLQAGHVVRPAPGALRYAQDKLTARQRMQAIGLPVPAFAAAHSAGEVDAFAAEHGWPVVLKARRGGYDGRGVRVIGAIEEIGAVEWGSGEAQWLVEECVPIAQEIAVLLARSSRGEVAVYPVIHTVQEDGICTSLAMPAACSPHVATRAAEVATTIADDIDATGIMATELFVTADERVLVNEIALRPHNSGHATIEACVTSQFEQHLRAVLGWPLGSTAMRAPHAVMVNVIGVEGSPADFSQTLPAALGIEGAAVHLYRKASRPGRKLGHVTALGDDEADARVRATTATRRLLAPQP